MPHHNCIAWACLVSAVAAAPACSPGGPPSRTSGTIVVDQTVADDLVTAGRSIRVASTVDGDVAAAGAEITVEGPVNGYVMSGGRIVTLSGPVGNDVWAAGEQVRIDSSIGNNAMVAGRTVVLTPRTTVGHNARLAGSEVRSEGRIDGNLSIGAARAEIGGEIAGAVEARADQVTLLPGAVVRGDLVVRSPRPPAISPDATVAGSVRYSETRADSGWSAWAVFWAISYLSLLLVGLVVVSFSPARAARVADVIRTRTLSSTVAGLVVLVGVPVAAALLLVTVLGIPLAVALLALYVIALVFSGAFVSYRVGSWSLERLHRAVQTRWRVMAVGALIVSLGLSLPVVGWIVMLAVVLVGAGALALDWRDSRAMTSWDAGREALASSLRPHFNLRGTRGG